MDLSTVDLLLGKVVSILEKEAALLSGVRDEIIEIKLELNSMRAFLEDADKTAGVQSRGKNAWVANVRDMACEVEDVIHEFMYLMSKQQQWRGNKYSSFFLKGIHFPQNLFLRYKTADKLQKINKKLANIENRNKRYGVNQVEGKGAEKTEGMPGNFDPNQRKIESESSLFVKDDELVGIEKTQNELLGRLTSGEPQRIVISVVGMGGSGKTTLVANTFNKEIVKQHFDCCAWITVSQQYSVEELLRSMTKEIIYKKKNEKDVENLNTMSYRELGEMLQSYLQRRRYLIVLDDVWTINLWREISRVFPDGSYGSRVMITTRNHDVASFQFGNISHILELKPLGESEAWTLFCRKAFPKTNGQCPADLYSLARELAEKCEGLPLAIEALGGLLSCKTSKNAWEIVRDNLNWELSNNHELERVKRILLLSYYHLPTRLKHCFLYCCIFPEDYLINRKRLMRLWMAEGFVEPVQGVKPEVVAERYLMELVCRGLLQDVVRDGSQRPKACKMHDILRELAVSISKTEKFVTISDGKEAIQDEVVTFYNLRYMNLTKTQVKELPKSIGKLCNLESLVLKDTPVKELPSGIVKLKNLRHLFCYRYTDNWKDFEYFVSVRVPPSIFSMKNLQVLTSVEAGDTFVKELYRMTLLKKLCITNVKEANEKDLCHSIGNLSLLRYLWVMSSNEEERLKMDALVAAPPHLAKLHLVGKLEKVPHWFNSLHNLTGLTLFWSRLRQDSLAHIQSLPNLGQLRLTNAFEGERLCFAEGFQKLQELRIYNFPELKKIVINKGVMAGLQVLDIVECQNFVELPHGLENLADLKNVYLWNVSSEITEEIWGYAASMEEPAKLIGRVEGDEHKLMWYLYH